MSSTRPNGQIPPDDERSFREFLARAMDRLLKFAERSDRRWEAQERQWDELQRRWRQDRLEQAQAAADVGSMFAKLSAQIDRSTELTVAALKSVLAGLKQVNVELRRLRTRPGAG